MQEFAQKVDKIIKNSKMSKRNLNYKFENFEVNSNNKKVYQSLKEYSEKLVNLKERKGLILVGNNGVGKTHLACSIANELIKNGIPIIYGTLINLLAELKNSYDSDNNISVAKKGFEWAGELHMAEKEAISESERNKT